MFNSSMSSEAAGQLTYALKRYLTLGVAVLVFTSACGGITEVAGEVDDPNLSTATLSNVGANEEIPEEKASEPEEETSDSVEPVSADLNDLASTNLDDRRAASPTPSGDYLDITNFGVFHGSSGHTHDDSLEGGRTPITTEALVSYNGLRSFLDLEAADLAEIGQWAYENDLTNNDEPYDQQLQGAGLYIAMQGAKVGWIRDDAFDPQIVADSQRMAREGRTDEVMVMVDSFGHPGYGDYLSQNGLVETFVNTLKMEPHYGGWMHGNMHGDSPFLGGNGEVIARSHDVNHLTVLSHDQTQPFMNDTFEWPQWPALDVPGADVIDYYQSMVVLGDPHGDPIR